MELAYRNRNRGYQQLRVWQDATELYRAVSGAFRSWPYELKRVASQQIASADSVHRNIAEGYCRRSIHEYIQHLYIALGSLGETVSALFACRRADQLRQQDFDVLNAQAFKLENELLRLVESLEAKRERGDWIDHLVVKESNAAYGLESATPDPSPPPLGSTAPSLQHSTSPSLQETRL